MIVLVQVLKINERSNGCGDGSLESVVTQVSANKSNESSGPGKTGRMYVQLLKIGKGCNGWWKRSGEVIGFQNSKSPFTSRFCESFNRYVSKQQPVHLRNAS